MIVDLTLRRASAGWLNALLLAVMLVPAVTAAAPVTYQFATTVRAVNPGAAGFPSSLAGVAVGDAISGTLRYDGASPPSGSAFPGTFGLATPYALTGFSLEVTIDGTLFDAWPGSPTAFVWNDDLPGDGLLFVNVAAPGQQQFQLGNLLLGAATFGDESLPQGAIAGAFLIVIGGAGQSPTWLESNAFSGLSPATVPLPPALGLFAAGVLAVARRRHQRGVAR